MHQTLHGCLCFCASGRIFPERFGILLFPGALGRFDALRAGFHASNLLISAQLNGAWLCIHIGSHYLQ